MSSSDRVVSLADYRQRKNLVEKLKMIDQEELANKYKTLSVHQQLRGSLNPTLVELLDASKEHADFGIEVMLPYTQNLTPLVFNAGTEKETYAKDYGADIYIPVIDSAEAFEVTPTNLLFRYVLPSPYYHDREQESPFATESREEAHFLRLETPSVQSATVFMENVPLLIEAANTMYDILGSQIRDYRK